MSPFGQKFDGANCYFTSDWHLQHTNICRGVSKWDNLAGTRDFNSVEGMNRAILDSITETVPNNGILFNCGDIVFGKKDNLKNYLDKLWVMEHHYLYGNHCDWLRKKPEYHNLFTSIQDYLEIFCSDRTGKYRRVCLFHYGMKVWHDSHKGSIHLFGHSHGSLPSENHERSLDVGWDVFKRPISFYEICDIMDRKTWKPVDHHNKRTQ